MKGRGARGANQTTLVLDPFAVATVLGLGLAFFALVDWTWKASTEPVVASGRDLYAAWRLAAGDALYRDIGHAAGPLPAHLNALAFRLFGPGVSTLLLWNGLLTALTGWLLHRTVAEIGGRLAAFVATLGFVTLFAFGHYESVASFNWLAPRSQAATLSVLLALLTLTALRHYRTAPTAPAAATLGSCIGLAVLTSPEASLACGAAALGGAGALAYGQRRPWGRVVAHTGALVAGLALVLVIAGLAIAIRSDIATAERSLSYALLPFAEPDRLSGPLASEVARGLGFDAPGRFVLIQGVAAVLWSLLLLPAAALAFGVRDGRGARRWGGALAFGLAAGIGIGVSSGWPDRDWIAWASPLLLVTLVVLGQSAYAISDSRVDEDDSAVARSAGILALALAALALLSVTGLRPRVFDHGFTAGVLAFAIAVLVLVAWVPRRLEAGGHAGWLLRGAALGLLAAFCVGHLRITAGNLAERDHELATGRDAILVRSEVGTVLEEALDRIEAEVPADARLLVVPEGALVNYLARRRTGWTQPSLVPTELARLGEAELLESLMADPPEYVLVVHRETMELGAAAFGRDYAQVLGGWIEKHFEPVARFGAAPFASPAFGAELRKREAALDPEAPNPG